MVAFLPGQGKYWSQANLAAAEAATKSMLASKPPALYGASPSNTTCLKKNNVIGVNSDKSSW